MTVDTKYVKNLEGYVIKLENQLETALEQLADTESVVDAFREYVEWNHNLFVKMSWKGPPPYSYASHPQHQLNEVVERAAGVSFDNARKGVTKKLMRKMRARGRKQKIQIMVQKNLEDLKNSEQKHGKVVFDIIFKGITYTWDVSYVQK